MKKIQLKSLKWFLLVGVMACGMLPALAGATPVRFDIAGQFTTPAAGTFTGTMDVDTTIGKLLAISLQFPGLGDFDVLQQSIAPGSRLWQIRVDSAAGDILLLTFRTPQASGSLGSLGSLVDFDGGAIVTGSARGPSIGRNTTGFSGTITRATTVSVPEPTALGVFGLGLLLLGVFAGLRRRYN